MSGPVKVLNMNKVQKQLGDFTHRDLPSAIARGFGNTAEQGVVAGKRELSSKLTLRSKWILNGVKGMPVKPNQQKAFIRSYNKYGIADGSIYIRGATRPKNDLGFLLDHEKGTNRKAKNKFMAIPLRGLRQWKKSDYRTKAGRTKKRLKPHGNAMMGSEYAEQMKNAKPGSFVAVRKSTKPKRRRKGGRRRTKYQAPFVMTRGSKTGRKKRSGDKLFLLYKFKKITNQTRKMQWGDRVETLVKTRLRPNVVREIQRIIPKK